MSFERGYISHHMVTDQDEMEAVLAHPLILLTDQKILNPSALDTARSIADAEGRPLLIVAEEIAPEVIVTLLEAAPPGKYLIVHPPEYGQEARTDADVWKDGDPVTLDYATATGADQAVLVVTDANGNIASREEVPLGAHQAEWLGADATGLPLPQGYYRLTVESYRGDQKLGTAPVQSYARILEARNGTTGTTLVLEGGAEVASDRISALRIPPG